MIITKSIDLTPAQVREMVRNYMHALGLVPRDINPIMQLDAKMEIGVKKTATPPGQRFIVMWDEKHD